MSKKLSHVKKNETITLKIEDLTHEGNGVGKVNGYPIFIPKALPNEQAVIKVVKVNKNFGYGKLLEVIQRSPHRIDADHQCGGCQLQHMSYELEQIGRASRRERSRRTGGGGRRGGQRGRRFVRVSPGGGRVRRR